MRVLPVTMRVARFTVLALAMEACGTGMPDDDARADDAASDVRAFDAARTDSHDATSTDVAANDAPTDGVPDVLPDASRDAASEPAFDELPWTSVGYGVAHKDSHNPRGENVFIAYAGYEVTLEESEAWVTALYDAWLRDRGVRYVYAVQGPADVEYSTLEIGNTHLVASMLPQLSPSTHFIAVAAHSSGGWVACELLGQLYHQGYDPAGLTRGRLVYYDEEGVQSCVDADEVVAMRRVYFISAHTDVPPGGWAWNAMFMMQGAARLGSGGFIAYDASASGCAPDDGGCLHVSLVNTHPVTAQHTDYADYSLGAVNTWFLSSTAADLPP